MCLRWLRWGEGGLLVVRKMGRWFASRTEAKLFEVGSYYVMIPARLRRVCQDPLFATLPIIRRMMD